MKITIIYDNEVFKKGLRADWGFSCLVEAENAPRILFDAGTNGSMLLSNMEKLNIVPGSIDEVFISHNHFDHIGGLSAFINVNNDVKVYVPSSLRGVRGVKEVISVSEHLKMHKNIFSTGELNGVEQSLAIKTQKGIAVIAGCSHPGVGCILESASQFGKVCALIGGLHGFKEFNLLEGLDLICPTHCTQYKSKIKSLYPSKYVDGGAGKVIEI